MYNSAGPFKTMPTINLNAQDLIERLQGKKRLLNKIRNYHSFSRSLKMYISIYAKIKCTFLHAYVL